MKRKIVKTINDVILYILLITSSIVMVTPLLWMILTSFKTYDEVNASQIVWFPAKLQIGNYLDMLANSSFIRAYANSSFVTILAVGGALISIAAVSYAFSRIEWPGRNLIFILMLSTMMIPFQALVVPQYILFGKFDWLGTFNPIVLPGFFAGGAAMIFLLRQFMMQIPHEMDEAAFIEGASHFQIWWHIIIPLCKPALATIATFLFIGTWNSLLAPVIYLQKAALYTLPVYVTALVNPQQTAQPWQIVMTASVLTTLPLIIVFFFTQRYLLESITISGSKG
ncbi:MAG: carbohydrate ABC transporter permease [Anaerolineaceae bacterium]|nr:carbohydrate ABC transporter permease [Anaerolineaceae bacterium]